MYIWLNMNNLYIYIKKIYIIWNKDAIRTFNCNYTRQNRTLTGRIPEDKMDEKMFNNNFYFIHCEYFSLIKTNRNFFHDGVKRINYVLRLDDDWKEKL